MNIPHWYCLDYLTRYEEKWPQKSWDAKNIAYAVKGWPFKGYVRLPKSGKQYKAEHLEDLRTTFLSAAGRTGLPGLVSQDVSIIPIPNSDMTGTSGNDHRIIGSANTFLQGYQEKNPTSPHDITVDPILRWIEPKKASHQQDGYRKPSDYIGKQMLTGGVCKPVILFDDVYTSGSQAIASTLFLRQFGCEVIAVVTMAKTVQEPSENPIQWRKGICLTQVIQFPVV